MQKLKFPEGFLWGVATSGYQIEGDSQNADWWQWEQNGKTKEKSGRACDYWNKWQQDHALLNELGCNTFRLGIEWSRIEPLEGEFSREAMEHYREILQDLKNKNIKTVVTLWHWVSPIWFSQKYGFESSQAVHLFTRYSEKIAKELGELIDVWVVFNEPMVPLGQGYLAGQFPPGKKDPVAFWKALNHMSEAYRQTYKIIHALKVDAEVGISNLYNWYESEGLGFLGSAVNGVAKWFRVDLFQNKIKGYQDYFGIDYYRLGKICFDMKKQGYLGFSIEEDKENVMGWVTYPQGMYKVLRQAYEKNHLPIYILENGMPTTSGLDDEQRIKFICDHLKFVHQAISEGIEVKGYLHWSLLDNFEWLYGFEPRFGLVEVDFQTQERKLRQSALAYAKICKENTIETEN